MDGSRRSALQRHRVNRVVNFAYANIADSLDLDLLADVACLSKYHFSRVFSAHANETPLQFLWRIRLERAARNLVYFRDQSIIDIALGAGFASPQTFSQTFRKRYRVSPRAFRSANAPGHGRAPAWTRMARIDWPDALAPGTDGAQLPVRIEARPAYRMAYIRHIGPYFGTNCRITAAFSTLERWARARDLWRDDTTGLGLCPDHSAFTPAAFCLYDVGMLVPDSIEEDDIVSIQRIPAGRYAVLNATCDARRMNNVWEWFTSVWLPASGETREVLPCYEFYPPAGGRPIGPENGVELCLRLKMR